MDRSRLKIAVSACLLGRAVRYDGAQRYNVTVAEILARDFTLVEVCPESELGLGVPRPPIDIYLEDGEPRLWMKAEGRDLTEEMRGWARQRVGELLDEGVRGAICKARSPSCGFGSTPHWERGHSQPLRFGDGFYVTALRELAPELPIIEDEALTVPAQRTAFFKAVRAFRR